MRVLHFSDIHLRQPWRKVPVADWLGKRVIGGLNLLRGRWRVFAEAERKVSALEPFRRRVGADLVLCTGDYTAMGTRGEFGLARTAVARLMEAPLGYVHVPGNHDLYLSDVVRQGRFSGAFGDTLISDLPEAVAGDGPWPLVRFIGRDVAVVAVNSARPNPQPWRSSGLVPPDELAAFERVLRRPELRDRFVFVITHYAPCLEQGRPDRRLHGLVNAPAFLGVCGLIDRGAILCGHVHRRYTVTLDGVAAPVFCAGSATKQGDERLWVFDVEKGAARATGGRWVEDGYELESGVTVRF